jgi:glutaredoxin
MNTMKIVAACATLAWALGSFSHNALAQQLYRSVDANGKVSFSDQPPQTSSNGKVAAARNGKFAEPTTSGTGNSILPGDLRATATKFPVTLYTGKDCAPCATARNALVARGVPFTEKTINNNEDIDSLTNLFGVATLPSASIGGQQLKGYSDQEWTQYLDAAGYPKTSLLPAAYRSPAPSPLVVKAAAAQPAAAAPAERAAAPAPAAVQPANPAGIKF